MLKVTVIAEGIEVSTAETTLTGSPVRRFETLAFVGGVAYGEPTVSFGEPKEARETHEAVVANWNKVVAYTLRKALEQGDL